MLLFIGQTHVFFEYGGGNKLIFVSKKGTCLNFYQERFKDLMKLIRISRMMKRSLVSKSKYSHGYFR